MTLQNHPSERRSVDKAEMAERVVAFDGDDTLWLCNAGQKRWEDECKRSGVEGLIGRDLVKPFRRAIRQFGYSPEGVKSALCAAGRECNRTNEWMRRLERLPDVMRDLELTLPPGVELTLNRLKQEGLSLWIITKGELLRQSMKLARFPYLDAFDVIEVVDRKDAATYAKILRANGYAASALTMIGDRFLEDIAPPVRLGASGVHVPSGYERLIGPLENLLPTTRIQVCRAIEDVPELVLSHRRRKFAKMPLLQLFNLSIIRYTNGLRMSERPR